MISCCILGGPYALADGKVIYESICANCHSKLFMNSPQLGEKKAWAPLISEGQIIITAHGFVGVRAMPPKGGRVDLTLNQFSDALNYMVNKSGGDWKTPSKEQFEAIKVEILKRGNR